MQRILILEPHASGHRVPYLRWLIESATSAGQRVVLGAPVSVRRHPMIEALAQSNAFDWIETELPELRVMVASGRLRREFQYRDYFREATEHARECATIDLIILPYLDYCFHALALAGAPFGGVPWTAITMLLTPGRRFDSRRMLLPLLLRDPKLRLLFSITEVDSAQARTRRAAKLVYLPDPGDLRRVVSKESARSYLGIRSNALVLLVYGTIDRRKGLMQLMAALEMPGAPRATLLIVGQQSPEMKAFLSAPQFANRRSLGLLVDVNEFVDDLMQARAFAAADAVWLGYVGHLATSGVLVLAGLARRAVIVTRAGEMGRLARQHALGPTVDSENVEEIVNALHLISNPKRLEQSAEACHRVFRTHDAVQVGARFFRALGVTDQACG